MQFIYLKIFPQVCQSPSSINEEAAHEFRENDLCPIDGLCPHIRVPKMRRSIQRQSQGDHLLLLGPVSLHGIRPTHLSGKPQGYPSLPAGNPVQTLSFGHPGKSLPQYPLSPILLILSATPERPVGNGSSGFPSGLFFLLPGARPRPLRITASQPRFERPFQAAASGLCGFRARIRKVTISSTVRLRSQADV